MPYPTIAGEDCGIWEGVRISAAPVSLKWVHKKQWVLIYSGVVGSSLQEDALACEKPHFQRGTGCMWSSCFPTLQTFSKSLHWDPFPQLCALSRQACSAVNASLTSSIIISEELLTVVCWVGLFHLSNPISGHFPLEGWGEEGRAVVAFWGWWRAERSHLKGKQKKCWRKPWPSLHKAITCVKTSMTGIQLCFIKVAGEFKLNNHLKMFIEGKILSYITTLNY